jgi:hypothetical protein
MKVQIKLVNPKPSVYQKKTTCRDCDKPRDRQGHLCQSCCDKRIIERTERYKWKNRKIKVCQFKGCNNKPNPRSLNCDYHSGKNQKKRFMNEIVSCKDCGCELGKRKYWTRNQVCSDCKVVGKERQRQKQQEYNKKWLKKNPNYLRDYQKKYYSTPKWNKYSREYRRKWGETHYNKYTLYNNTCQVGGCNNEIGFRQERYCNVHKGNNFRYTKRLKKYQLYNNTCLTESCNNEIGFHRHKYCDDCGEPLKTRIRGIKSRSVQR